MSKVEKYSTNNTRFLPSVEMTACKNVFLLSYYFFGNLEKITNFAENQNKKIMPQIYRYLKLVFSFVAAGEHLPVHVHVRDENDNQTIFDLVIKDEILIDIKIRKKAGANHISEKNQGIAKTFIRMYYAQIVKKWFQFFVLNKKIKPENIRKIENITIDVEELVSNLQDLDNHFYPTEKKELKNKKK